MMSELKEEKIKKISLSDKTFEDEYFNKPVDPKKRKWHLDDLFHFGTDLWKKDFSFLNDDHFVAPE